MKIICAAAIFFCCRVDAWAQINPLPNPDLENWHFTPDTLPDGWTASNDNFGIAQTSDAQHGNLAIELWTWYFYSSMGIVNGNYLFVNPYSWTSAGTPDTIWPTKLTGFYKLIGMPAGDSAVAAVCLKRWNNLANKIDTLGLYYSVLPPVSSYTYFEVIIPLQTPPVQSMDSAAVFIYNSSMRFRGLSGHFCDSASGGNCAYLFADNLNLGITTSVTETKQNLLNIFPNPVDKELHLNLKSTDAHSKLYVIRDFTGNVIHTGKLANGSDQINVLNLSNGFYWIEAETQSGRLRNRFEVIH